MTAQRPTIVAHITDLHIKPPGELAYGQVDTATALAELVATLNKLSPRPDLVVVTGDLVDGGKPVEFSHLRGLLQPLEIPIAVTCGNHDDRGGVQAAFADQPFATATALNQQRSVGALDIMLLAHFIRRSLARVVKGGDEAVGLA